MNRGTRALLRARELRVSKPIYLSIRDKIFVEFMKQNNQEILVSSSSENESMKSVAKRHDIP